jgi:hypothetical protein
MVVKIRYEKNNPQETLTSARQGYGVFSKYAEVWEGKGVCGLGSGEFLFVRTFPHRRRVVRKQTLDGNEPTRNDQNGRES